MPRLMRGLAVVVLAVELLWATAAAVQAHPFGPPQTVAIATDPADTAVLRLTWHPGAVDDLSLLRDYLRDGEVDQEALANPTSVTLGEAASAARELRDSSAFDAYLLAHLVVRAAGVACPGTVEPIDSLAADGAMVTFRCAVPVVDAEIMVSTLTDLHPAYKTFATGPGGVKAVYDVDHETHSWSVDATTAGGDGAMTTSAARSAVVQLSLTGGAIVATLAVVGLLLRRRRRKEVPA